MPHRARDVSTSHEGQKQRPQKRALDGRTLVFDEDQNQQVMWIEAVLPLPVGSVLELHDPRRNAEVSHIRLLLTPDNEAAVLCLDVRIGVVEEPRKQSAFVWSDEGYDL